MGSMLEGISAWDSTVLLEDFSTHVSNDSVTCGVWLAKKAWSEVYIAFVLNNSLFIKKNIVFEHKCI